MKKLCSKLFLFSLPFLIFVTVVVLVDPFNLFNVSRLIEPEYKLKTSAKLHYALWKLIEFRRAPAENILLGDSRTNALDVSRIESVSGEKYYNFAYGGGTVPEIVDTFWYAVQIKKPRKVFIGINFNQYNQFVSRNTFSEAKSISDNFLFYFINRSVIKSVRHNLYSQFIDNSFAIGKPPMTKDEFWLHQLKFVTPAFYRPYKYPGNFYQDLKKIATYCKQNNIMLTFIIFPTHVDLQRAVNDFNLSEYDLQFRKDLKSLGTVVDFDYPNSITTLKNNFEDPYHYNKDIGNEIIDVIWNINTCNDSICKRY